MEMLQAKWSRRRRRSCSPSRCTKSWSGSNSTLASYGLQTALPDSAAPGGARGRAAGPGAGQHADAHQPAVAAGHRALEGAVVARKSIRLKKPIFRWDEVSGQWRCWWGYKLTGTIPRNG